MAWTEPVLTEYKGRAGLTSITVSLPALCIDQMSDGSEEFNGICCL